MIQAEEEDNSDNGGSGNYNCGGAIMTTVAVAIMIMTAGDST